MTSSDQVFTIGFIALLYFIPTMVAGIRQHHNRGAIFVLNLLLGWTGLGWIAALIWAATAVRKPGAVM